MEIKASLSRIKLNPYLTSLFRRENCPLPFFNPNPGAIDEEYAKLLKDAEFKDVEVGAESGSNKMLKALGKNFTKDDIFRTAEDL